MAAIGRILDANLNRAREALRVMEDAARFALNAHDLTEGCKKLRHELRAAIDRLPAPPGWFEANRDVLGDVGASISTTSELRREGLLEIVIAAGKRLTEALRVIEELCKTLDVEVAGQVEALRYRAYTVEAQLLQRFGSGRAAQWRVCVVLTRAACKRPWQRVLAAALDHGADCIQVREKEMADRDLKEHIENVVREARQRGVSVIVNDRADIALAAGADGVHLGQGDLSIPDVRRIAGRALLIGASTHDLAEAQRAVESGADYCGVGTIFASSVKPNREPSGTTYLRSFLGRFPTRPHLAIGGITPKNVHLVVAAGAGGVAVSAAVCGADDPAAVVRSLRQALDSASAAGNGAEVVPKGASSAAPSLTH